MPGRAPSPSRRFATIGLVAAAKLTDSPTIRRLAKQAEARDDVGPAATALRYLRPDAEHVGIVVRVDHPDGAAGEESADERVWVAWLLQMQGDEGRFMVMMVNARSELSETQDVEVTDDLADMALEFAREEHGDLDFEMQPRPHGLRLVRLVSGDPGLCVRCRTSEPAVTGGNLLLAPEGPVCAGCLNLTEQIAWGEAAIAALRNAGAHAEQIAAVEREVAELRAQADAGPS